MGKAWRRLDLAGGGLQAANIRLASRLKQRRVAYALLALFPLGLHRRYLEERRGPWMYAAASSLAIVLAVLGHALPALATAALVVLAAVFDAFWIDGRITRINKAIRREVFLGQGLTPPAGYRGRTEADLPDARGPGESAGAVESTARPTPGSAGCSPERAPSFHEQERLLAEIARAKARPQAK